MSELKDKRIGIVVTGSYCTFEPVLEQIEQLATTGCSLLPVMSERAFHTDTKFGNATQWNARLEKACGRALVHTIVGAEPIGPQQLLDLIIVAPCSGNTLAKLANAITDSPALMAIKAHLRNQRPALLAIATNDGLSMNAKNIGMLLNMKNIFFVPFGQDGAHTKGNSLQSRFALIEQAAIEALDGRQLQPVLLGEGESLLP